MHLFGAFRKDQLLPLFGAREDTLAPFWRFSQATFLQRLFSALFARINRCHRIGIWLHTPQTRVPESSTLLLRLRALGKIGNEDEERFVRKDRNIAFGVPLPY